MVALKEDNSDAGDGWELKMQIFKWNFEYIVWTFLNHLNILLRGFGGKADDELMIVWFGVVCLQLHEVWEC